MRKILLLLIIFILFSVTIIYCPTITCWDSRVIQLVQEALKKLPLTIPMLPDCKLYILMIALPLLIGTSIFYRQKNYKNILILYSVPLVTFLLNCIIKPIIHRSRPIMELQQLIHPHSYSYVSSHSLVTFCLYGMVIYFIIKHCTNKILKYSLVIISVLWILFVGLSRIWLGVHYPTDVIGAYLLGITLVFVYIKLINMELKL